MSQTDGGRRVRWVWLVAAAVLGLALLLTSGIRYGECSDSVEPLLSRCTDGSVIPGEMLPWVWVGYAVLLVVAITMAVRHRR
ncbi:hypothetical protein ACTJKH_01995 [Microbacterium sp. 22215]|uniref:hypothetical protein n=1 Tax=Microbacterium sp. 22215 TaxID=3453893 RepID=UPI003F84814A